MTMLLVFDRFRAAAWTGRALWAAWLVWGMVWAAPGVHAREVRVGVYENPPKMMLGAGGEPAGIFGDLLGEIAREEGWSLRGVSCAWLECLAALEAGQIDLMPDVARTEAREARLDFHAVPAMHSWSALYVPRGSSVTSLLALKDKRIAVLAGSVQESHLAELLAAFGIGVTWVPVASLEEGFVRVSKGEADGAAANYFYGERHARDYGLKSSSVMFQPVQLFFAARRGANGDLLAAVDRHLKAWQGVEGSPYFRVMDRWMTQPPARVWPAWWGWVLGGGLAAILLVGVFNAFLRRQVRAQTATLEDDLVRLRAADEALGRQHAFFRSLIRTIPDLVWLKDPEGVYLACNPRFEAFFGAREQEIVGKSDYDFVDRELADFFRAHDRAATEAGRPMVNEEWLTFRSDGYQGLFETTKTPMHDSQGRLVGVLGIAHDITRRKLSEQALQQSEEHLKEAQALARIGNWSLDLRTGSAVWSDEEFRLLGYTPGAVAPSSEYFLNAVHPDDRDRVMAEMQRAMDPAETRPYQVVHRVVGPDGERIVEQLGKVMFDDDGQPVRMFGTTADITERKRIEAQIQHLAYHDSLTGLPNRALFLDRLSQSMAVNRRVARYGAVLFVDLDQFKQVNDVYGHSVGDEVLREVAQRLRHLLRSEDTVARFGGDEFVILLPELAADPDTAGSLGLAVAEKVRLALEQPNRVDGQDFLTTASIGVSLFPKDGEAVEDLIREADIAMYRAKDSGRNALMFFEQAMQAHVSERYALECDLRQAVGQGELRLYLQSQMGEHGQVLGAEALLRWQHPVRGLLAPDAFIPLAEESRLILSIGEWVLRESCRILARLQGAGGGCRMAVNVSPRQFRQSGFVAQVEAILAETGADPKELTLEITENLLLEHTDTVVAQMHALARLGLRFSIDDFGTGYSSLAYLRQLPLNELKIDKGFVRDLPQDANGVALVEAMLSMARHMHYDVVAEGVETREQLDFLADHGCHQYQGYFFHRPQPAEEWLASTRPPPSQTASL